MQPPQPPPRKRYENLWQQAQELLELYIESALSHPTDPGAPPIDLRELNTLTLILKRIQDARRDLEKHSQTAEKEDDPHEPPEELSPTHLARVARRLRGETHP